MRRRPFAVLCLISLTACGGQSERFAPASGGFAVQMPEPAPPTISEGPGREVTHTWCNSAGRSLTEGLWRRALGRPFSYCVGYYDLPNPPTDSGRAFNELRDAEAEALGSLRTPGSVRVEKDQSIALRGTPGREFRLRTPSGHTLKERAFAVGPRVYYLWVQGRPREVDSSAATAFLDSFVLAQ
jgi:hypothetical protein